MHFPQIKYTPRVQIIEKLSTSRTPVPPPGSLTAVPPTGVPVPFTPLPGSRPPRTLPTD